MADSSEFTKTDDLGSLRIWGGPAQGLRHGANGVLYAQYRTQSFAGSSRAPMRLRSQKPVVEVAPPRARSGGAGRRC